MKIVTDDVHLFSNICEVNITCTAREPNSPLTSDPGYLTVDLCNLTSKLGTESLRRYDQVTTGSTHNVIGTVNNVFSMTLFPCIFIGNFAYLH